MICPFLRDECVEDACAVWSYQSDLCSLLLVGEGMQNLSFALDDTNKDCGLRIEVLKRDD